MTSFRRRYHSPSLSRPLGERVPWYGGIVWSIVSGVVFSACGSSSGATCPDAPVTAPVVCPECPAPPKPAGKAVKVSREALGMERPRKLELVALTVDGTRALVRAEDRTVGSYFQTLSLGDTPTPKVEKTFMFDRPTEGTVKVQALKGFKAHPGPPSQVNAKGVSLVAADRGEAVVVYALAAERAVPVIELPRLVDADGRSSDVTMVKLAWDPSGERAIIIHRQTLAADLGFSSDWIHVVPVPASALPF